MNAFFFQKKNDFIFFIFPISPQPGKNFIKN